jgi:hypothetical protein
MHQVSLPDGAHIRLFNDVKDLSEVFIGRAQQSLLCKATVPSQVHQLCCIIDLRFVVTAFHLYTGVYRAYINYQAQQQPRSSSFHDELCFQLGGNKNIPVSVKAFSLSAASSHVAAVFIALPGVYDLQENETGEHSFQDICDILDAAGTEMDWPITASNHVTLPLERIENLTRMFKLSPSECSTGNRLEAAVLTRVAMKDC